MPLDIDALKTLLKKLGESLRIQPTGELPLEPGTSVSLAVLPPGARLSIVDPDVASRQVRLDVAGDIAGQVTGTATGQAVGALTGQVTGQLTDALGNLAQDLTGALTGSVTETATSTSVDALAGGLTGTITGALPIAVDVPVKVEIEWRLYRYGSVPPPTSPSGPGGHGGHSAPTLASGGVAAGALAVPGPLQQKIPLTEGLDFLAPFGLRLPALSFVLTLVREPSVRHPVRFVRIVIEATARLSVEGVTPEPVSVTLPDITVWLPAIPVPTILVLARHRNLNIGRAKGGALVVVVPHDSPIIGLNDLNEQLRRLRRLLRPLAGIRRFALLLLGLNRLNAALTESPTAAFRAARQLRNLNRIILYKQKEQQYLLWGDADDDIEAENEMSSLLLVGPPQRQVSCYTARDFEGWRLTVATGAEMFAAILDLHATPLALEPPTALAPTPWVDAPPNEGFGNRISSLRFTDFARPDPVDPAPPDLGGFDPGDPSDPDDPADRLSP